VKTKLLTLDGALAPTLPALLALLDAPVNDPAWQTLDPAQRRRRMLEGVRYLLLQEARQQPLLLIFEDLHWIDSETQAVLDSLVESLGSARILLLLTYRPEYQHGWAGKTYYSQLRLDALAGESGGQLLDALLGDDPTLSSLKQLLANHGNPFFLEETVRTLAETKALEGSSSSYRLIRPVETIQAPATVQVILASRIERLSLEDKHLLRLAAVIGRSVPFSLLRAVADLPDDALRDGLDRLQAAEFVYETGLFPDLEYGFKHALTQEVAYGGILQDRRRELHARIVNALETLHQERVRE
jgi:predicted ATPase